MMSASGRSVGCTPRFAVGFVFVLVASFAVMTCGSGKSNNILNNSTILTENGPLEGIVAAQMNQYLGIPYAAPPVGVLRWMPPQAFGQWQGVFQATQFSNECPQAGGGDENCLFLNIYTPDLETKHAVMVWIHGGGLTSGAGSD